MHLVRWLLLAVLLAVALPARAGQVVVDFLDVGQGDAILIRGGGKAVLVDGGPAEARVDRLLRRMGVQRLDLVVATHPHADHVAGLERVLRGFEVGLFLDSGQTHTTGLWDRVLTAIEEEQIPYRTARRDMTLRLGDEAVLHVLFPTPRPLRGTRSDLNSNSVVLLLDHDEIEFLLAGDAEAPTEAALLRHGLPEVEVLKVAHHGSEHSSTRRFLAALSPAWAVVSCGEGNRYGHPDPAALERLSAAGATVFRTDRSGHVRALSDGSSLEFMEGTLPEIRRPVLVRAAPAPAAEPAPDLSGVQPPDPAHDDLQARPRKRRFLFFGPRDRTR